MKKGLAGAIISLLIILSVVFAVLYLSSSSLYSAQVSDLRSVVDDRENKMIDLNADINELSSELQVLNDSLADQTAKAELLSAEVENSKNIISHYPLHD